MNSQWIPSSWYFISLLACILLTMALALRPERTCRVLIYWFSSVVVKNLWLVGIVLRFLCFSEKQHISGEMGNMLGSLTHGAQEALKLGQESNFPYLPQEGSIQEAMAQWEVERCHEACQLWRRVEAKQSHNKRARTLNMLRIYKNVALYSW